MNYQQAIDYLFSRLPMYQRVGAAAFKKDLTNTVALCSYLDNPHQKFPSVHIAGTNGKGSSSHFLASILYEAGFKVGLYTSPHLKSFTERIKVDGKPMEELAVAKFVTNHREKIEEITPSFFEITVAMAFDHFASNQVDIAIIEVGLGGRLDSTNVVTPLVSLITNISLDHTDMLGDTLQQIAGEKAGIIKPGVPVVISEKQESVEQVFVQRANAIGSPIYFADDEFKVSSNGGVKIVKESKNIFTGIKQPIAANYIDYNLPGVLKTIALLDDCGFTISNENIAAGISNIVINTGLKGRWQQLGQNPTIICDIGHNEAGISAILANLENLPYKNLHIVWGMVKEKDTANILNLLPRNAHYYFCEPQIPRALGLQDLIQTAQDLEFPNISGIGDVNQSINIARENADSDDLIFVGGSTFVVAEISDL